MAAEDYGLARRMWHQLEPVHAVFWYAPEVFAEAAALGYDVTTRWPSYFAWRHWRPVQMRGGRSGSKTVKVINSSIGRNGHAGRRWA